MTFRDGDVVIHLQSGAERVVRLVAGGRVLLTQPVHGFYGFAPEALEKVGKNK